MLRKLTLLGAVLALAALPTLSQAKKAKAGGPKTATIELEKGGTIVFKFFPKEAPGTVANFAKLADKGFYNGLNFHRVEPGFVIQGGDPAGNGSGGPGWTIKAEFNSHPHLRGTVAMARTNDPDSAGSQFYICLAPAPFLDNKYTVFGQLVSGDELLNDIKVGDKMKTVTIQR
jgi:cyclophilin family peptidyl-prolyl cis-trans isomerase